MELATEGELIAVTMPWNSKQVSKCYSSFYVNDDREFYCLSDVKSLQIKVAGFVTTADCCECECSHHVETQIAIEITPASW